MGGESFHHYGHPPVRSSSRILDHELQDDDSHGRQPSSLQAPSITDNDEALERLLKDGSSDDEEEFADVASYAGDEMPTLFMHLTSGVEGTGPDPNADMPDGWMEISGGTRHAAVNTAYPEKSSGDNSDEKKSEAAELEATTAGKIGDPNHDVWGRPVSTRKPGVDGFTQSEVHHICHNLGIRIRELASFPVPDPGRVHTCLMSMEEVDLLTKNLGFVCRNLGLDAEQVWDLSADVHDVSKLGILSRERTVRLCERMGMQLVDLLYLSEEDTDPNLLKLIKHGRHADDHFCGKKSAANDNDAANKVNALHEVIAVLGENMRQRKQQTIVATNTFTSILLSLHHFRHHRDQSLNGTAPFIITPPGPATKLETQQHHLLTTLHDLLVYDFESV